MTQPYDYDPALDGLAGYDPSVPAPLPAVPAPGGLSDLYALGPTGRGPIDHVAVGGKQFNDHRLTENGPMMSSAEPMASSASGYQGAPMAPDYVPTSASDATDANMSGGPVASYGPPELAMSSSPPASVAQASQLAATVPATPKDAAKAAQAAAKPPKPITGAADYVGATNTQLQQESGRQMANRVTASDGYDARLAQSGDEAKDEARSVQIQTAESIAEGEAHRRRMQVIADDSWQFADKEIGDIEKREKEVAKMKVDPTRALPKSVMGNIMGALGAALGAGGAALTGGRNAFMDIVNQAIERDIDAQKAEIANARNGIASSKDTLAERMRAYGNKEKAEIAQHVSYLDGVDRFMAGIAAKSQSRQVQDNIAQMRAGLAENRAQLLGGYADRIVNGRMAAAAAAQHSKFEMMKWMTEEARKNRELDIKDKEAGAKGNATYVKTLDGYVANEGLVKDLYKSTNAIDTTLNTLDEIDALMAKGSRMSPEDRGKLQQAARRLVISEKDRNELGQLTGGDWSLMPTSPDTVNDWIRNGQIGSLKQLRAQTLANRSQMRQNFIIRDTAGNPVGRSARPGRMPSSLEQKGD